MRTAITCTVLLLATSASAVERDRFLFELRGVPVGVVELTYEPATREYRYRSIHLYTRGTSRDRTTRSAVFVVDEGSGRDAKSGRVLESYALWRASLSDGCVDSLDELSARAGRLCVSRENPGDGAWTVRFGDGQRGAFARVDGRLQSLTVGEAQFRRMAAGEADPSAPEDLFGSGWRIEGPQSGALMLSGAAGTASTPPLAAAGEAEQWPDESSLTALAREVHRSFAADPDALCTAFVDRFVQRARASGRSARVVHGVVVEPGSSVALPHVWIRARVGTRDVDVDPTLGIAVTPRTHLPIAVVAADDVSGTAGKAWLELFAGRVRVTRR